jgi:hypothetical protein
LCQKDLYIRLLAQPLRQSSLFSDLHAGQIIGSRLHSYGKQKVDI